MEAAKADVRRGKQLPNKPTFASHAVPVFMLPSEMLKAVGLGCFQVRYALGFWILGLGSKLRRGLE